MNIDAIAKEKMDDWFAQWTLLEAQIRTAHQMRNGEVTRLMEEGIVLFDRLVIEAGEEIMPINGVERITFIKKKPGQYACYRQLDELFKETKKRTARLRLQAAKQRGKTISK